jgi:multidomain signaling protein FimX
MKGGVRQFAYIKPDRFIEIQSAIGVLASEDFMAQLAELLRTQLTRATCAADSAATASCLLERGTARDVETWAENVVKRVGEHTFAIDDKTLVGHGDGGSRTAAGRTPIPTSNGRGVTDAVERSAAAATRRQSDVRRGQSDTDTRVQAYDKIWVKHIKSALMENRFRLVQQPIASLLGEDKGMFDVLVRMLDEQGNEVLPAEFIAAAERNDLMKNIDRWVIGASMSFAPTARRPASSCASRRTRCSTRA